MAVNRRRLLKTLTCAGGIGGIVPAAADAQAPALTTDRSNLSPGRLQIVKPIWERRLTPLQAVRNFEVDDAVGLIVKL